jgi:hypothetical protein
MSDRSTILKTFNTHFFEFLDDVIAIFPENKEIAIARKSFDTIRRANPTAILKVWGKFVYAPYKEVIDNGQIEFFFEKDYGSDLGHLANASEIMKMIDVVRGSVKLMSETNKQHSMKYIQNLSKLSVLYG